MAKPVAPAFDPTDVPANSGTGYPEPYKAKVFGKRHKRKLGDTAGITRFGVNVVVIEPGAVSSMRHWHDNQDEFIYVLEGEITLATNAGRQRLKPGQFAGFPAGKADGHQLINETDRPVKYLEVGDRTGPDQVAYPDVDLAAHSADGVKFTFTRKDGTPY